MNPSDWRILDFEPDSTRQCVLANLNDLNDLNDLNGPDRAFIFKGASDSEGEYRWVGELKAEFAQSIAQLIAERMARIPLNKSEWLRRSERIGKRKN